MTERERILAAVRGEAPDRIPWAPRLEFWHRARLRRGDLPDALKGLTTEGIAAQLGVGCYASIPDFTRLEEETDMLDRVLGILNVPVLAHRTVLDGVERRVTRRGEERVIEYHTPVGWIRTAEVFTEEMLDAGASITWVSECAIREPRDFAVLRYIFEHARVEPRGGYAARRKMVGENGVAVAYVIGTACPVHHVMKELMPVEQFFYAMHDCPDEVEALAEAMAPYYAEMKRLALETDAEVVLLGANYDDSITHPKFFEKHILPPLSGYAEELHGKGKLLMTHTDGENRRLMPLYLRTGFDIADSVCPAPMTRLSVDDFYAGFAGRIAIWGGIPAVLLCPDNVDDAEFRRWIDALVARYGRATRFVLGVSDMVTADCRWDRLCYITEKVNAIQ